ncbi:MAG: hypothetical protein HY678_01415 [Chloroflexi bacterium]|nr:hypothetical protein [Chloroflexota bacterium]
MALDKVEADLGNIAADSQAFESMVVANFGTSLLSVAVTSTEVVDGCGTVSLPSTSAQVPAQKVAELPVVFGPHTESGPHAYRIQLASDDPERPLTTVNVRFNVVEPPATRSGGPWLRVDKEAVNIGPVPYDSPLYEHFTLWNAGDQPLVLAGTPQLRVEDGC